MTGKVPITVERVQYYSGLDGNNADDYFRAQQRNALLYSEVISPFTDALKESTGYDDGIRPDKEEEVAHDIGENRFVMKVTPTIKRPGYKEVFDELDGYIDSKIAQYKSGERPVGIMTIDGEPYISANEILKLIGKQRKKVKSNGVKIEIAESPPLPFGLGSTVVPLGMDMSELNEGNTGRYLEAMSMSEQFREFVAAFEEELLGLTGYGNSHVPEQTEHMYRHLGNHVFHVRSIPYDSTGWGKVIGGLDKKPGKRSPENGGDLVLITNDIEVPRLSIYRTKTRDGEHLVRLKAVRKRIDRLVKANTETKVRQKPIIHYPIV